MLISSVMNVNAQSKLFHDAQRDFSQKFWQVFNINVILLQESHNKVLRTYMLKILMVIVFLELP